MYDTRFTQKHFISTKRASPKPCLTLPKIVFQTSLKDPRDAWYSIPSKRWFYCCLVTLLNVSQLISTFSIHSNTEVTILAPYVSNSDFSREQLYKDVLPKSFTLVEGYLYNITRFVEQYLHLMCKI